MVSPPVPRNLQQVSTSASLLNRLNQGPDREAAWAELVYRYGPPIYHWFLRWGVQQADAADLVQEVFVRLLRRMKEFQYDETKSFRAYLKTLSRYAWYDLRERRGELGLPSTDDTRALMEVEAREDLERRLAEEFDRELLSEAMARVASRVQTSTWEAFRLQAIEGLDAREVSLRLRMKIASVYKARSNVISKLQETVRELEGLEKLAGEPDLPDPEERDSEIPGSD